MLVVVLPKYAEFREVVVSRVVCQIQINYFFLIVTIILLNDVWRLPIFWLSHSNILRLFKLRVIIHSSLPLLNGVIDNTLIIDALACLILTPKAHLSLLQLLCSLIDMILHL